MFGGRKSDAGSDEEHGIQGARPRRSAAGGTCDKPASRLVVVDRRHTGVVGQSARRACSALATAHALTDKIFGPADSHRRQVAQLAHRLLPNGAVRLERLRGFGATLGMLVTCACARLDFADGREGVLIAATEPAGRTMPLNERLQRLVEDADGRRLRLSRATARAWPPAHEPTSTAFITSLTPASRKRARSP